MKSLIITSILAIATIKNQIGMAGDREWATVGKVLTGVAAVSIVHRIIEPPQPTIIYTQPVVIQPQPIIVQQAVVMQQVPVYYTMPVVVYQPVYYQRRSHWHYHH